MLVPQLPRNLEAAVRDLRDPKPLVRASAARDLARHAGDHRERVVEHLMKALGDADADVRRTALDALGELHATDAFDEIAKRVGDSEGVVREAAIAALGELGDARALPILEEALDDKRPEVRFQAVMAYPRTGASSKDAVRALVRASGDDDEYVAHIAFRMAEELADKEGKGLDGRIIERAARAIKHRAPRVRAVAGIVLASAGDDRGDGVLVELVSGKLETPEHEDLVAAIELAGERKLTKATADLERRAFGGFLGLGKDPLAWHARTALARMGHERAKAEILRDLGAMSLHKRTLAVAAAGRARLVEARSAIEAMRGVPAKAESSAVESALELLDEAARAGENDRS